MNILRFIPAAALAAAMFVPAAALATLQVNLNGFQRVVPYATAGDNCDVLPMDGAPATVNCPDGTKGTITLYGSSEDSPACELDFWYEGGRWRAQLSHQNGNGTCSLHWSNPTTLQLSVH